MVDLVLVGGLLFVLFGVAIYAALYRDAAEKRNVGEDAKATAYGLAILPLAVLSPLLTSVPPAWKLYHKIHTWSAWQMQKAASADALANVRHPNDKEDVLPAKFTEGSEDDKDLTGWKVKGLGEKRYATGIRGGASSRFGKADLIHINEDDMEQGTWAEAAIDAAFALDRERYLFRNARVTIEQMVVDAGNGAQAMADGGVEKAARTVDVSLGKPGILDDVLVPITSRAGYDGQVISWNQYSNIKSEKSDQESVREAKNAGWMAAKLDDVEGMDLLKVALLVAAWSFILLFQAEIGAMIANFGGGGGGGGGGAIGSALGVLLPVGLRRK